MYEFRENSRRVFFWCQKASSNFKRMFERPVALFGFNAGPSHIQADHEAIGANFNERG